MSLVLIGGTGRSGTNITRKILAFSQDIASPNFETRYTVDPYGILPFLKLVESNSSPFSIDEFLKKHFAFLKKLAHKNPVQSAFNKMIKKIPGNQKELLLTGFSYAEWNLEGHFPGYAERLGEYIGHFEHDSYCASRPGYVPLSAKPKLNYVRNSMHNSTYSAASRFLGGNIKAAMQASNASVYVDDNTYNLLYASIFSKIVPDTKFIHVRRHPMDVVASYVNQRWCPSSPELAAVIISDLLDNIREQLTQVPSAKCFTISLEKLVEDSEYLVNQLCGFINVDVEKNMKNVDLTRSNIGRYKRQFSRNQQMQLNEILAPHIESFEKLRKSGF